MGKGEIACYKQFLLFPQCFQKACFPGASKGVIVWEWVKSLPHSSDFLMILSKETFINIVGKEENAGNQHFLLFLQCFTTLPKQVLIFIVTFIS